MKLAIHEKIVKSIPVFEIVPAISDYEALYLTEDQRKEMPGGPYRPTASCNWGVFSTTKCFSNTYLRHPMFGKDSAFLLSKNHIQSWKKLRFWNNVLLIAQDY